MLAAVSIRKNFVPATLLAYPYALHSGAHRYARGDRATRYLRLEGYHLNRPDQSTLLWRTRKKHLPYRETSVWDRRRGKASWLYCAR